MSLDVVAVPAFAESSPPPQPMVVSLWATDVHCPEDSIPSAHRTAPAFVPSKPSQTPKNPAISPQPLKVSVPPDLSLAPSVADTPTTPGTSGSSGTKRHARIPAPGRANVPDEAPPSPLTELDTSEHSDSDSDSASDSDSKKIQCPTGVARWKLPDLQQFLQWDSTKLANIQVDKDPLDVLTILTSSGTYQEFSEGTPQKGVFPQARQSQVEEVLRSCMDNF